MPILTIQRRMRELGRIRTGIQESYTKDGKTRKRPVKLLTFRVTSANRELIDAVAAYYGGEVGTWESPRGPEGEVVITSPYLDAIVPPGEVVDQWMELWAGGGCQRRCDGVTEQLSGRPCLCPSDPKARIAAAAEGNACKPTTRLNVALPAIPDLGVWRVETHGYYAAVELAGTAETLRQATEQGIFIRARLRIEARQIKRPNEVRKDFTVPILELPDFILNAQLPAGPVVGGSRQLAAGTPPAPRALPAGPALPGQSSFRPAPAPAAAPAGEDLVAAAPEPVEAFAPAPGASVALALSGEAFPEYLREHGVTDGAFVREVKEQLFGERTSLDDQERGRLALEAVRRAQEVPA